ncbi:MAG: hypothetical protein ABI119_08185 [Gemmatimonadaceae bacterium]
MLFIFLPAMDSGIDYGHRDGAGGPGPVGGGGGGVGFGDNGAPRVHFVQITPPPSVAAVQPTPVVPPPIIPPVTPPIVTPKPVAPPTPAASSVTQPVTVPIPGSGSGVSGAGTGGTAGAGSGTGGGVGSGEGPGHGSGVGPGTGGGAAKNFPPSLKQFVLPPLPTPASVKGFTLTAWFDVDSTGKATLLRFTPTPDRSYNNRVRETLLAARFRPAVRPDGVAIRDTIDIQMFF